MNKTFKLLTFGLFFLIFIYVVLPNPEFPQPPQDSLQSKEPADTETPFRRAYFTNLTREEVVAHYKKEFNSKYILPTLRLNYPPEESQTIIRDQTMSTFLEELVHPLRESLYINGFEPKSEKDTIIIEGLHWRQKIIIRYVPSIVWLRLLILGLTIAVGLLLMREYSHGKK